jgi:hypothetical protein
MPRVNKPQADPIRLASRYRIQASSDFTSVTPPHRFSLAVTLTKLAANTNTSRLSYLLQSPPSHMQPDSHRHRFKMPCRSNFWHRNRADEMPATLPSPTGAPVVKDWRKVRRTYLRGLRKQTRTVILLLALLEACNLQPSSQANANDTTGSQDWSS